MDPLSIPHDAPPPPPSLGKMQQTIPAQPKIPVPEEKVRINQHAPRPSMVGEIIKTILLFAAIFLGGVAIAYVVLAKIDDIKRTFEPKAASESRPTTTIIPSPTIKLNPWSANRLNLKYSDDFTQIDPQNKSQYQPSLAGSSSKNLGGIKDNSSESTMFISSNLSNPDTCKYYASGNTAKILEKTSDRNGQTYSFTDLGDTRIYHVFNLDTCFEMLIKKSPESSDDIWTKFETILDTITFT